MRKKQIEVIEGDGINIGKAFRDFGKKIDKGAKKAGRDISRSANKTFSKKNMRKVRKVLKEDIAPVAVTVGIPMVGALAGVAGTMAGGPMGGIMAQQLTQGLATSLIPDKYQSDNPYVQMAGTMMGQMTDMAISGEPPNPYEMQMMMGQLTDQIGKDMRRGQNKPNPVKMGKIAYDDENPLADLLQQIMTEKPVIKKKTAKELAEELKQQEQAFQDEYKQVQLGNLQDRGISGITPEDIKPSGITQMRKNVYIQPTSEYPQLEGSLRGLQGAGLKKRRGRPRKQEKQGLQIEIIKKPSYKKFSHAKNKSLEQLLEAMEEKENKLTKKSMAKSLKGLIDVLEEERRPLYDI